MLSEPLLASYVVYERPRRRAWPGSNELLLVGIGLGLGLLGATASGASGRAVVAAPDGSAGERSSPRASGCGSLPSPDVAA